MTFIEQDKNKNNCKLGYPLSLTRFMVNCTQTKCFLYSYKIHIYLSSSEYLNGSESTFRTFSIWKVVTRTKFTSSELKFFLIWFACFEMHYILWKFWIAARHTFWLKYKFTILFAVDTLVAMVALKMNHINDNVFIHRIWLIELNGILWFRCDENFVIEMHYSLSSIELSSRQIESDLSLKRTLAVRIYNKWICFMTIDLVAGYWTRMNEIQSAINDGTFICRDLWFSCIF